MQHHELYWWTNQALPQRSTPAKSQLLPFRSFQTVLLKTIQARDITRLMVFTECAWRWAVDFIDETVQFLESFFQLLLIFSVKTFCWRLVPFRGHSACLIKHLQGQILILEIWKPVFHYYQIGPLWKPVIFKCKGVLLAWSLQTKSI